jgi:hypothetical protein
MLIVYKDDEEIVFADFDFDSECKYTDFVTLHGNYLLRRIQKIQKRSVLSKAPANSGSLRYRSTQLAWKLNRPRLIEGSIEFPKGVVQIQEVSNLSHRS